MLDSQLQCNEGANISGVLILEHRRKGKLLLRRTMPNLETDAYKALRANLRIGAAVTAPTHIAIGTGTTAATEADETLESEIEAGDGARHTATRTVTTITVTDDASQYTHTFTLDADTDVTEAGLLNASSEGTLCYRRVFTAVQCLAGETLKVTWRSKS